MTLPVGIGLGWRPETALLVERRARGLVFAEVIAEAVDPRRLPPALAFAVDQGLPVVAHGVGLDLGGTGPLDPARVKRFVDVARALRSPLASEHVAFCRAGGRESPHFLPVPHTRAQLAVLVDNVRRVQDALPVPLALENVAAPLVWPGDELAEADFLAELVERTGALLLLDASNVHANLVNHGGDLGRYLARLPLDRVAYMHAAGGAQVETGMYRDTHAHPIAPPVLATLAQILARTGAVPLLLERDHHHDRGLADELGVLAAALVAAPALPSSRAPTPRPAHDNAHPSPRPPAHDNAHTSPRPPASDALAHDTYASPRPPTRSDVLAHDTHASPRPPTRSDVLAHDTHASPQPTRSDVLAHDTHASPRPPTRSDVLAHHTHQRTPVDHIVAHYGSRAALGARHAALLDALLDGGALPEGFAPRHVAEARSIIGAKRARHPTTS